MLCMKQKEVQKSIRTHLPTKKVQKTDFQMAALFSVEQECQNNFFV